MSLDLYRYDKPSGHLFCKHCGVNYVSKRHNDDCLGIKEVVSLVMNRAYAFTCSYATAYNQYLTLGERNCFTLEDVEKYIMKEK